MMEVTAYLFYCRKWAIDNPNGSTFSIFHTRHLSSAYRRETYSSMNIAIPPSSYCQNLSAIRSSLLWLEACSVPAIKGSSSGDLIVSSLLVAAANQRRICRAGDEVERSCADLIG